MPRPRKNIQGGPKKCYIAILLLWLSYVFCIDIKEGTQIFNNQLFCVFHFIFSHVFFSQCTSKYRYIQLESLISGMQSFFCCNPLQNLLLCAIQPFFIRISTSGALVVIIHISHFSPAWPATVYCLRSVKQLEKYKYCHQCQQCQQ